MPRQDIVTSLRNGIKREHSIKQAQQTLINSGYNINEVQEAANYLAGEFEQSKQPQELEYKEEQEEQAKQTQQEQSPEKIVKKKKSLIGIIILFTTLVLLIGLLAVGIIFREQIIEFIEELF